MVVDERVDARGNSYYWLGFERRRSNPPRGSDLRAVYDGYISVTPLHMNLTHTDSKDALARMLRDDGNGA
jgi:5'-nucleotidase